MVQLEKMRARIQEALKRLGTLSLRERVILLCLLVLVVGSGGDFIFNKIYLERHQELKAAVATAEKQLRHNARLLSRAELIHTQYQRFESSATVVRDSIFTETEILRELADRAGKTVHVKNIVPRQGYHEGQNVVFVALDLEGPFASVMKYLTEILHEMPSEVASLSLAPWTGPGQGVMCRLSLRVVCLES